MEDSNEDAIFRDLSSAVGIHEVGLDANDLFGDQRADWPAAALALPGAGDPVTTASTLTAGTTEPGDDALTQHAPAPVVEIEVNHEQQAEQLAPCQWFQLFYQLSGEVKGRPVPVRQANPVMEYIKNAVSNHSTSPFTDTGSICGIGSRRASSKTAHVHPDFDSTGASGANSFSTIRSLLDRNMDRCHPVSSSSGVVEIRSDNPEVKLKSHQRWAQLNDLLIELKIPVKFGMGWSAQSNPKLYFQISPSAAQVLSVRNDFTWNRAYKLKSASEPPQPLGKKDFWIARTIQRCESAAIIFWGTRGECVAEQDRWEHNGDMANRTLPDIPESAHRKRRKVDCEWEMLTDDSQHPYDWQWTEGGSHTRRYSFRSSTAGALDD